MFSRVNQKLLKVFDLPSWIIPFYKNEKYFAKISIFSKLFLPPNSTRHRIS